MGPYENISQIKGAGKFLFTGSHHCSDLLILFVFSYDELIFLTLGSVFARTGSILGGDAERYFMINLLMEKHMSKELPCLR